jgi:uncharacterized membrane protein YhaH (DUF805 family)
MVLQFSKGGVSELFALYVAILVFFLLCFLKVAYQQVSERFKDSPCMMATALIAIFPFWPLLVFCSVPCITLRRIKGSSSDKWWFMVPH